MSEWNAMTYAGKDTILRVVREEADRMFALAGQPGAWEAPTACESWKVKDVIGHSLVLTAFGRVNGGTAVGDQALAGRFLNLFYRI